MSDSRAARPLEAQGLGRDFGSRSALASVDLCVEPGQLVGLAGPNGSGKTTFLKLAAGLLRPTRGSVRLFGHDPAEDRVAAMGSARFVFAPPPAYEHLRARDQALRLARLSDPRVEARQVDAALERLGLGQRGRDRVREFSFGMRTRLALAAALVPRPQLLVLDEPTDGLDPLAVLELRAVLRELADEGLAVVLSSHLLIELEELVDQLLVLDGGRTLYHGSPGDWTRGRARLRLRTSNDAASLAALQEHLPGADLKLEEAGLSLSADSGLDLEQARLWLSSKDLQLLAFSREELPLEQVLLEALRASRGEQP